MKRLTEWFNRKRNEQKGDYPHSSLWDFYKALPANDGRWLWRQMWFLETLTLVGGVFIGIIFGLMLSEIIV